MKPQLQDPEIEIFRQNEQSAITNQIRYGLLLVLLGLILLASGAMFHAAGLSSAGSAYVLTYLRIPYGEFQYHRDRIAAIQVLVTVAERHGVNSPEAEKIKQVFRDAAAAAIIGSRGRPNE